MPARRGGVADETFTVLVEAALAGDEAAWRVLCDRLRNVTWKVIGSFRLGVHDSNDAYAATLFRLAEHLGDVRDPERLPGWIARTATHEVYAILRRRRRVEPMDDYDDLVADEPEPGARLVRSEVHDLVQAGLDRLPWRCQQLLRLLTLDPPLAYRDICVVLEMPQGAIGPTRQRCLEKLAATPEMQTYAAERQS